MRQLLRLFEDINNIKHAERKGWVKMGMLSPIDTIASHSYGATILGWYLAKKEKGFSEQKIIKLLLVHDLIMSRMPDLTPEDEDFPKKPKMEMQAAAQILEDMPVEMRKEFSALFEEYLGQATEDSRLAREADKLDTLIQSFFYSKQRGEDHLSRFVASYQGKIKSATGKAIIKTLREELIL